MDRDRAGTGSFSLHHSPPPYTVLCIQRNQTLRRVLLSESLRRERCGLCDALVQHDVWKEEEQFYEREQIMLVSHCVEHKFVSTDCSTLSSVLDKYQLPRPSKDLLVWHYGSRAGG